MLQTHTHQADDEEHVILGTVAPQANDKPAKRTACCRVLKDSRKWQVHEMNPALGLTDVAACSAVRTYACVPSRIPGQMKLGHEASRFAVIIESMCLPTKRLVGHLQETPGLGPIVPVAQLDDLIAHPSPNERTIHGAALESPRKVHLQLSGDAEEDPRRMAVINHTAGHAMRHQRCSRTLSLTPPTECPM